MAGKADFTEEEWKALQKGVTGAGILVATSDRSFFDSFKKAGALAKHLAAARRNSTSQLVREASETKGTGLSFRDSPQEVETETLDALRSTVSLLQTKAPDEVDAYRTFVLDVAQSVSEAAGGGEEAESAEIAKIREALGASSG
jgi:polyhydroxyalkanoate synthesis regulator phasin